MRLVKRLLLWGVPALTMVLVLGIGFGIGWQVFFGPKKRKVSDRAFERSTQRLERGRYLVENVAGCMDCHSPVDPSNPRRPKPGFVGAGDVVMPEGPGRIVAANITSDPVHGIGSWKDDEIARAIREGVDREGRTLFPMMPYANYREMSDEDVASIVVYLRSLEPVPHNPGKTQVIVPVRFLMNTAPRPVTEPVNKQFATPEERGRYLVKMGSCADCHTPFNERHQPLPGLEFSGGAHMKERQGEATSANLTPDETGIKGYTAESFRQMMHTGIRGGRKLNPLMPASYYGGQTDEDLNAIFAYLRTLKPIRHVIESNAPPTLCRVCNQQHGGGEKN